MSTHLNWGASYLVHDFYQRFILRGQEVSERHLVLVSRIVTASLMLVTVVLTLGLDTAKQAFDLLLQIGAGTGLVYLLRWFWWRVNAWSEIAGMASSFLIAVGTMIYQKTPAWTNLETADQDLYTKWILLGSVGTTTAVWIITTFLTSPAPRETLERFYRIARPAGPGWKRLRQEVPDLPASTDSLAQAFLGWTTGCAFVYSALFTVGNLLYGEMVPAAIGGVIFVAAGIGLARLLPAMLSKD